MDISFPSTAGMDGNKHWLLTVEDSTDYALSYFLKEKSELKDMMMSLLKDLKAMYGVTESYDNAGENEAYEWLCKQEGMEIKFKYITPVHHSKMRELRENLSPYLMRYIAEKWEVFLFFEKWSMG